MNLRFRLPKFTLTCVYINMSTSSGTELKIDDGAGDGSRTTFSCLGPCIFSIQCCMEGSWPPSTTTSPCSFPLPSTVPWYFESSPVLLCFFLSANWR